MDKLNLCKSIDLDDNGPNKLKHCRDIMTPYISSIINSSITQGIFPVKQKEARVLPIFKSGEKSDFNNCRPISILPTISKLFERHIATQMKSFLEKTNIIHKTQSEFRKKKIL